MSRNTFGRLALGALVFVAGMAVGGHNAVRAQAPRHIFEIRTYTAAEGKLPALLKRFKDYELPLFEKHGMHAVLYSVAAEAPRSQNTFVYILQHDSRESARAGWAGFVGEPDFKTAQQESDAGGKAVVHVDSIFVDPTDFSPLK
jgi:hypothetical protein